MLKLSRHIGQRIFIDNGRIRIKLLGFHGSEVILGIDAPRDTDVDREEIYYAKRTKANNEK